MRGIEFPFVSIASTKTEEGDGTVTLKLIEENKLISTFEYKGRCREAKHSLKHVSLNSLQIQGNANSLRTSKPQLEIN